jgi:hypothetical protein
MLVGNYSNFNKLPLKYTGTGAPGQTAAIQSGNQSNFVQSGRRRNRLMQDMTTTAIYFYALPNGSYPTLSFFIPQKAGQIGSSNQIYGLGVPSGTLAGGLNAISSLTGDGTITNGNLTLIAQLIASLTGAGNVSPPPSLVGTLYLISNQLTGAGAVTATLNAFASVQANLAGTGSVTLTPYATGQLAANITGSSVLSPENLAAAVWSAIASQYNVTGTMGNKLNAAASGSIDYATLAAAVLAAMNVAPPDVNIAKINGLVVDGTGTEANPWGPV